MKKLRKILLVYLSAAMIVLLSGCLTRQGTFGTKTIMIYMIGSDLEAQYGFGSYNIKAIQNSDVDLDSTKIIFKFGGSLSWQNNQISSKGGTYELTSDYQLKAIEEKKEDMGKASTLSRFLNDSYQRYQTDSYDLILWDHGGGSILGYGYDENYQSTLKMTDLQKALADSPFNKENKLEMIGFDACLMSCIETGFMVKDYARFMVASQETIPGYGWDYSFLKDVNGIIDGESLSTAIIDRYVSFYEDISKEQEVYLDTTLSSLDLSHMDQVEKDMNLLFKKVDVSLNTKDISNSSFSNLSTDRNEVKSFGKSSQYNYDLVDLSALVKEFEKDYPDEAKSLQNSLNDMIIYEKGNVENASGVSIYYPYENISHIKEYLKEYQQFQFADEYYQYIYNFSQILLKGNTKESQSLIKDKISTEKADHIERLSIELSDEEAKNFVGGKYCILQKDKEDEHVYMPVYWDTDVQLTGTTLTANYNNKVMTICQGNEQYTTTLMGYDSTSEYIRYRLPAILFRFQKDGKRDFKIQRVYYILNVDRKTLEVTLAGVVPADNNNKTNLSAKNYIDVSEYDSVEFLSILMRVKYDKDGNPLPFREWKSTGVLQAISMKINDEFEFKLMDISKGEFYATMMVQDIYGNVYGSNIQKFNTK